MRSAEADSSLATSAIHLLHRASQCAGDVFADEMSKEGLTPRQYAVLLSVAENEGVSQTGLVMRTGIDRSTLADIIRRMLRKGLLQRRRTKEDARAYSVRLTDEGSRVLRATEPAAKRADERLLAALSPEESRLLINALAKLVAAAPQPSASELGVAGD